MYRVVDQASNYADIELIDESERIVTEPQPVRQEDYSDFTL